MRSKPMVPNSPDQPQSSSSPVLGAAETADGSPDSQVLDALRQAMTEIADRHAEAQAEPDAASARQAAQRRTATTDRSSDTRQQNARKPGARTTRTRTRRRRKPPVEAPAEESPDAVAWSSPETEHPDWIADLVAESAAAGDLEETPPVAERVSWDVAPTNTGADGADDDDEEPVEDFETSYARGRKSAMNMLAMRDHSRTELRDKLLKKDVLPDAVEELLDKLEKSNLLDDTEYAHRYVRAHRERRRLSRTALKRELNKKGIAPEIISDAVDEVDGEEDLARAVAEKKAASTRGLDRAVRERRILGMLARRGFPSGVCIKVTRAVLDED